jgi:hypothetical protein
MKTRKQSSKKSENQNKNLPQAVTPTPPEGFIYRSMGRVGLRPLGVQVGKAAEVASELRHAPDYKDQFGVGAPDPLAFADSLDSASAWSLEVERATLWLKYVTQRERLAWMAVMPSSSKLKPRFEQASLTDPELRTRYPALSTFFTATDLRGRRSGSTRLRNERKKRKELQKPTEASASSGSPEPSSGKPASVLPAPLVSVHTSSNGAMTA